MAEAPRNGHGHGHEAQLPVGLLDELAGPDAQRVRPAEVDRARRHVVDRSFDDREVVQEIASRLLLLSGC